MPENPLGVSGHRVGVKRRRSRLETASPPEKPIDKKNTCQNFENKARFEGFQFGLKERPKKRGWPFAWWIRLKKELAPRQIKTSSPSRKSRKTEVRTIFRLSHVGEDGQKRDRTDLRVTEVGWVERATFSKRFSGKKQIEREGGVDLKGHALFEHPTRVPRMARRYNATWKLI